MQAYTVAYLKIPYSVTSEDEENGKTSHLGH